MKPSDQHEGETQHPINPGQHIEMAQTADRMAFECRDQDEPPRELKDAPEFRRIGFWHRQKAREVLLP